MMLIPGSEGFPPRFPYSCLWSNSDSEKFFRLKQNPTGLISLFDD